jgi:hypothetical protein
VFGVFDGHGREMGKLASSVATQSIKAYFLEDGAFQVSNEYTNDVHHRIHFLPVSLIYKYVLVIVTSLHIESGIATGGINERDL